jgi:hypothetical protein
MVIQENRRRLISMAAKCCRTQARPGACILAGLFVALILVLSYSRTALAQQSLQENRGSLGGQIVGIRTVNNMPAVTLRLGAVQNDTLTIFLNKDTKLQVCNESYPLMWTVNHDATVTYHELGGVAVADSIYEKC